MLRNRKQFAAFDLDPYEEMTGIYTIDPAHSTLGFSVRHAMISNVRGKFSSFEGLLKLDGTTPARSEVHVSVQTESLDTGVPDRDAHLRGPQFFDSSTYPLMTFRSTGIVPFGDNEFRLVGNLGIRDVALPVAISLTLGGAGQDSYGRHRIGFEGTATLQRSDWGLNWNAPLEAGGVLISDKVKLVLDISAVRQDRRDAA